MKLYNLGVLHFSETLQRVAETVAQALLVHFDLADLSMGGGTVLQARWDHRASCDLDLFCKSDAFARVHRQCGEEVERAVVERAGADPQRTWMEYMALYCEIEGVEATLMPHTFILDETFDEVLPGNVPLWLQSTSEILAKKLRHRLHGANTVEVRDVYDLAFAVRADPVAFGEAKSALSLQQRAEVCALIAQLPKGWSGHTNKPLIDPAAEWDEAELVERVHAALTSDLSIDHPPGVSS